jgi:hypothetical protein
MVLLLSSEVELQFSVVLVLGFPLQHDLCFPLCRPMSVNLLPKYIQVPGPPLILRVIAQFFSAQGNFGDLEI